MYFEKIWTARAMEQHPSDTSMLKHLSCAEAPQALEWWLSVLEHSYRIHQNMVEQFWIFHEN